MSGSVDDRRRAERIRRVRRARRRRALLAAGSVVTGLGLVVAVVVRLVVGGGDPGGAPSPAEVVTGLAEAIEAGDPLGALDLLAPDEVEGADELLRAAAPWVLGVPSSAIDDDGGLVSPIVGVDVGTVSIEEDGDRVAVASFEAAVPVDVADGEGLVATAARLGDVGAPPDGAGVARIGVELVLVELDGRWYASPLMTLGRRAAGALGLPTGDAARLEGGGDGRSAGASPPRGDAADALGALVDAVVDRDAERVAAALDGGEARAARYLHDALAELLARPDELEGSAVAAGAGGDRASLDELELVVTTDGDERRLAVVEGCLTFGSPPGSGDAGGCLLDLGADAAADGTRPPSIVVGTEGDDDARRVRLAPAAVELAVRLVGRPDQRSALLAALGAARLDRATPAEWGSDVDVDFDGQVHDVEALALEAGESYQVTATGGHRVEVLVDGGDGLRAAPDGIVAAEGDGSARVVVSSELAGVGDDGGCEVLAGCRATGRGSTTLRLRRAERQEVAFPTVVSGDLGPGDVRTLVLVVERAEAVRLDVAGDGLAWRLDGEPGDEVPSEVELSAGRHELTIANTGAERSTSYVVTPSAP